MPEYIVGMDKLFAIDLDSPEEAEAELAERINTGQLDLDPSDCQVYEEVPDDE